MTIKNGDLPAMAIEFNGFGLYAPEAHYGLTKREQFAAMAMQSIAAKSGWHVSPSEIASESVKLADALLAKLERTK